MSFYFCLIYREDDYRASPVGPPMDRRLPPGPRPPPPMDPRSPPPYAIRPPFPPGRSPPHFDRYPPPRGPRPPYPRPPPPHLHSPPRIGSPSDFEDSSAGEGAFGFLFLFLGSNSPIFFRLCCN